MSAEEPGSRRIRLLLDGISPEVREPIVASGSTVIGGRPEDFAAFIRAEITKWSKVKTDAGIKTQ